MAVEIQVSSILKAWALLTFLTQLHETIAKRPRSRKSRLEERVSLALLSYQTGVAYLPTRTGHIFKDDNDEIRQRKAGEVKPFDAEKDLCEQFRFVRKTMRSLIDELQRPFAFSAGHLSASLAILRQVDAEKLKDSHA